MLARVMLARLGMTAAALAVAACAALAAGAPIPIGEGLVLYPRHVPVATWRAHPELHPFVVRARDGTRLRGWIVAGSRPHAPWTLTFTGNAGTAQSMLGIGMWFARRTGSTTVLWDYRGFGFSDGKPGIAATRDDALRVYDAIRARSGGDLVLHGHSFGTTIATHVATVRPIRALVLHAAPSSAPELLGAFRDRYFPPFMHRLRPMPTGAIRENFDLVSEIRRVRAPTIVLHGTADATIPFREGREVEAAAGARVKRFVALPGVPHPVIDYDTPGGDQLVAFLAAI
jgi:pimeloyl-ACP methyl ester carboxylesterase